MSEWTNGFLWGVGLTIWAVGWIWEIAKAASK
jgi:hypothetical protein